ncbi:MAG: lipid-A-disaccharide synthase [Maricaulaceae bacterium]|jgi:lipid-A-disaccharide synthase
MALKVFLVAAEPSGDRLGGALATALREQAGEEITFCGVGGPRMQAHGVASPFDISELSVLGFVDGLLAYRRVVRRADETAALAVAEQPDIAVLIDSWGFTLRVAQRLRRLLPNLPIVKYVGPQVWASRPGRARTLAAAADVVLTLQPFEPPYFEEAGLKAVFVGHPVLDENAEGDGPGFRARYNIPAEDKLLLVLFGSRAAEARRIMEPFADAMTRLRERFGGGLHLVAPLAASVASQVRAASADDPRLAEAIMVDEPEHVDAFAAADAALACSGTVVTELAIAGTPSVVAYKLGPVTHFLMKPVFKAPHISLVNMAAGERVIPEFVQGEATGAALAEAVGRLLTDEAYAAETRAKLARAVAQMRGEGGSASGRAAAAVLDLLRTRGSAPDGASPRG